MVSKKNSKKESTKGKIKLNQSDEKVLRKLSEKARGKSRLFSSYEIGSDKETEISLGSSGHISVQRRGLGSHMNRTIGITKLGVDYSEGKWPKKPANTAVPPQQQHWDILKYPHLAEKSMNKVDNENKIVFMVSIRSNKKQIKEAVEKLFSVKVVSVDTLITTKTEKKAVVKLDKNFSAADIASRLGVL